MDQDTDRQTTQFDPSPIPSLDLMRPKLPIPVMPDKSAWEKMYWYVWEQLLDRLRLQHLESGQSGPYVASERHNSRFMWDSSMLGMTGILGRRAYPFINTLDPFYAAQQSDGFVCREYDLATGKPQFEPYHPDSIGPNLLAWTEWRYFRATGDHTRLETVFPKLYRLYKWHRDNRTWQNGLYWASAVSSGMDRQERIPGGAHHHAHWSWIGASFIGALNAFLLQRMAILLNRHDLVDQLGRDRDRLRAAINHHCWNPTTGFYHDVDRDGTTFGPKSIAALWGLYDKELMSDAQRSALIGHLSHPDSFGTPFGIPALAADAPQFDPLGGYWRGGVWAPSTYMVLKGLRRAGHARLGHQIATRFIEQIQTVWFETGRFWENYSPTEAKPGVPAAADEWVWAALATSTMFIEDVIGIWSDWPQRTVYWNRFIESDEYYGVQQFPIGNQDQLDILSDGKVIRITTTAAFTLNVKTATKSLKAAVAAGTSEIPLA